VQFGCDDPRALDAIDRAMKRHDGRPTTVDNINGSLMPTGTSRDAALRRLRKDRPDLHAMVLAVDAGLKKTDPAAVNFRSAHPCIYGRYATCGKYFRLSAKFVT
jgi:hypothetical protein